MDKIYALLSTLLLAVFPLAESYAFGSLGGSAFPLTYISTNPVNGADAFNQILGIINSQCVAQTNSPVLTVQDGVFTVQNTSDATKQFIFSLGGATTGTKMTLADVCTGNCTMTLPAATDTIAGLSTTQTFSGTDTFSGTINATGSLVVSTAGTLTGTGTVTLASAGAITENGALSFGSAASINPNGIVFSNPLNANPLILDRVVSVTVASANENINLINSASGRVIYPSGGLTVMASGTATGATNVLLTCFPSDRTALSIPIAALINNAPIGMELSGTTLNTIGSAMVNGCNASDALMVSTTGTLTGTTVLYFNIPYTVQ